MKFAANRSGRTLVSSDSTATKKTLGEKRTLIYDLYGQVPHNNIFLRHPPLISDENARSRLEEEERSARILSGHQGPFLGALPRYSSPPESGGEENC
jgi:hypothetical protein